MRVAHTPSPVTDVSPDAPCSPGEKFRASAATNTLREIARTGRDAQAWKDYLGQLRREKEQWKGDRIRRASSNWGLCKALTKSKKSWGDEYMISSSSSTPVEDIKAHFDKVFHDEKQTDIHQQLKGVSDTLCVDKAVVLFTEAEVREAILSGKNGKATGPDCIPTELLKIMMENDTSLNAFKVYFDEILKSGEVPHPWDQSVVHSCLRYFRQPRQNSFGQ